MSWYREGSINLVNGSVDVIGVGTAFKSEVRFSDILLVGGELYEVTRIESDTKLKLTTPYTGATVSGTSFAIIRNLTNASNFDLMKKVEEFLTDRQRNLDEFTDWINADPDTGGTPNAGKFPLTDRYGVTVYVKSPQQLDYENGLRVNRQEELIDETEALLADSEARLIAIGDQQTWANQILGYKNDAAASATLAQKWAENAVGVAVETGKYSAKHHAAKAATSATNAANSEASATASKNSASTSATNAAASATNASTSASTATTKAGEATTSATNAAGSATAAASSATAAQAAKTAAETAKTAAQSSESGAAISASNASSSAAAALSSSNTAKDWAEKTSGPVTGSQYSAKHHAVAAASSASDAATRQADVQTRQDDIILRQADVQSRQSNVVSLESSATASKNAAATSATNAATSATNAAGSATNAATSATTATSQATKASKWAEEAVDVQVEAGKYSAKHHATKASQSQAAAQATAEAVAVYVDQAQESAIIASSAEASAVAAASDASSSASTAVAARDQAVAAAASLTGSMSEFGSIDLSSGSYPAKPTSAGFWKVTVGGTVGAESYGAGDTLVYSKNLDQFYKIDNTESVSSVNGRTGVVSLSAADVGALPAAGTAAAATKLATARTISLTGGATGSASFDGTGNVSISVVVLDSSHAHAIGDIGGLQASLNGKQASLGYTPVQQGTGVGQSSNAVKIGWSASGLLLTVDSTDFANNWPVSISRNAATATKLITSRTINGVAFDGTANITIADATKEPAFAAGTMAQYLRGDKTWQDLPAAVRSAAMTGLSTATNAVVTVADTLLTAVGKLQAQITGLASSKLDASANAVSATQLATARTIGMTGDVTWTSAGFNGSANVTGVATLANSGVAAGTYGKVTVNAKGLVTAGEVLAAADIPALDTGKLTTGTLPIARGGTGGATADAARTALGIGSMATRNVTISTAGPSGGVDGDIWFKV